MPRRPHKKSRSGCVECKKRHIKCDETHPICVNCVTAGSPCSFAKDSARKTQKLAANSISTPIISTASTPASAQSATQKSWTPSSQSLASDSVLSLEQLELLHHYSTNTYLTFVEDIRQQSVWQIAVVRYGLSYPFLMSQLLSIAALHLAHLHPSREKNYYAKAIELQSNAFNGFAAAQQQITADNCGAIMVFASLVALHNLADQRRIDGDDPNNYIDHLLGCITLMRSMRTMVIAHWWEEVKRKEELAPIFNIKSPEPPYDIPSEVQELSLLTHDADLSDVAKQAYDNAIDRLQWLYAVLQPLQESETARHLLAWPAQLREDYLDLANKRRPEAMIILAYFAVVLHLHRASWMVNDLGARLIKAINQLVGKYWDKWMAWPNKIVSLTGLTP